MSHRPDALVELALRVFPPRAPLVDLGGPPVPVAKLAGRRVVVVPGDEAIAYLREQERDGLEAVLADRPTRFAPLMPFLQALRASLRDDGRAIVADLVWQTAPTPELIRAFAPAAGRDKVRPIEGYEMQIEHAGFEIAERVDVARDTWTPSLSDEARAAVAADTRGAARVVAWVLAPANDE